MKKLFAFLALILLIPLAFAQEPVLDAKKAVLDTKSENFQAQMEAALELAESKNASAEELENIKEEFEDKREEALEAETKEEFETRLKELKELAKQFKEQAKDLIKDFKDELNEKIKNKLEEKKDKIEEKVTGSETSKKKAFVFVLETKIKDLKVLIEKQKEKGQESKVLEVTLGKFEEKKEDVESPDFKFEITKSINGTSIIGKVISVKDTIVETVKEMDEQ